MKMQIGLRKHFDGGVNYFRFHLTILSPVAMLKMQLECNAHWQCQTSDPYTGVVETFRLLFSQVLISA